MSEIITPGNNAPELFRIDNEDHLTRLLTALVGVWAKDHNEYITQINIELTKEDGKDKIASITFQAQTIND